MFKKGHKTPTGTRKGYKDAVFSMCKACIYDEYAHGTWLQQVSECTSDGRKRGLKCPLCDVRPLPKKRKKDED